VHRNGKSAMRAKDSKAVPCPHPLSLWACGITRGTDPVGGAVHGRQT
jgi:hypothetical protein